MPKEKCPICHGCGEIDSPELKNKMLRQKKDIANILRREGYSVREIMRLMKYKSPNSVSVLLDNDPILADSVIIRTGSIDAGAGKSFFDLMMPENLELNEKRNKDEPEIPLAEALRIPYEEYGEAMNRLADIIRNDKLNKK